MTTATKVAPRRGASSVKAIVIGRFEPLHIGHEHLIRYAQGCADSVTVLVGSSGEARTTKNPWTYEERTAMIAAAFPSVSTRPIFDFYNDLQWVEQVQSIISDLESDGSEVIIVGHNKDETTYYLHVFPGVRVIDAGFYSIYNSKCMDATKVRELLFERNTAFVTSVISPAVLEVIGRTMQTDEFENLRGDYEYIKKEQQKWAGAPYTPIMTTCDNVVVQSGHVLLIQRAGRPGRGLYALPGGFIDPKERLIDCALRELDEETQIKVPEKILRKSIVTKQEFDAPNRSLLGRIITHAYLYKLDDELPLPRVKGADDAAKAWWFPIAEIKTMRHMLFDDHYQIINTMVGKLDDSNN